MQRKEILFKRKNRVSSCNKKKTLLKGKNVHHHAIKENPLSKEKTTALCCAAEFLQTKTGR